VAVALTGMASLAAGGILVAEPAAHAGTNGQKVEVCQIPLYGFVSMKGYNQSGHWKSTGIRTVGGASCWEFTNYWWKGYVRIRTISPNGASRTMTSSISPSLSYTNWETCYMNEAFCAPS
jgi:hypothetical protein